MTELATPQGITPGAIPPTSTEQQPAPIAAPVDPNTSASPPAAQETGAPADTATPAESTPRDPDTGRFAKRTEQLQAQISSLRAQKGAEERALESLRRQTESLKAQYEAANKVDPSDFNANTAAQTAKAVIGVQYGVAQQQMEDHARRIAENRGATFNAKVDAARERIPDIDATLNAFRSLPVSEFAADLIAESDRSVEIANYLGRNPQEAFRIHSLPPAYQGAEIARIEAKVSTMPMKRISQAPAPVSTVSGGSGSPAPDLGSLSMADYIKAREAQSK